MIVTDALRWTPQDLFDHRNGSMLRDWIVNEHIGGPAGLGDPAIDGFFIDDYWCSTKNCEENPSMRGLHKSCPCHDPVQGATEIDSHQQKDMGLSDDEIKDITLAWNITMGAVQAKILKEKGYTWSLIPGQENADASPIMMKNSTCAAMLRAICTDGSVGRWQKYSTLFGLTTGPNQTLPQLEQDIAFFSIARGPFAWLGWGTWGIGWPFNPEPAHGTLPARPGGVPLPPILAKDFGTPKGLCKEASPGIFERTWSSGTFRLDCNKFVATLPPALPEIAKAKTDDDVLLPADQQLFDMTLSVGHRQMMKRRTPAVDGLNSDALNNPLPFPLPLNFSFGVAACEGKGIPGCYAAVPVAPKVSIRCSTQAGCTPGCGGSKLFQAAFSRYEARLSGGAPTPAAAERSQPRPSSAAQQYWVLNNTNCNLHDTGVGMKCSAADTIDQCKAKCVAAPGCGGFLLYKDGRKATKNASCWDDVGPLPSSDFGDNLYILRPGPQPAPSGTGATLSAVEVCVADSSEQLGLHTDESYSLDVPVTKGMLTVVKAKTIFGAMHGLESLAQLVDIRVGKGGTRTIPSAPVHLVDAPHMKFRGLMIDSGRHFLPVAKIKNIIEGVSMLKLNVIHWHTVDAQSFATCSAKFPSLCEQGAYPQNSTRYRNVPRAKYSPEDLRDVVAFGKEHGVRIMPEWDVPGHGSWGFGMPELMTSACKDALDVSRPQLYTFLREFLLEMGSIFEGDMLFLGGDELSTTCFDNSPTIAAWMKSKGLNASGAQQYFWQQMTKEVFPHLNKTISVWRANDKNRGPYASNLPKGSVLNVYQSLTTAWTQTVPSGTETIVSMAGEGWYLDGPACSGYNQNVWHCVYDFKGVPVPAGGKNRTSYLMDPAWTDAQRALFLGGETAIWGEGINEDNFDAYVWRSTAAAAERLWSSEQSLGCPEDICPGIHANPRRPVRAGPSHWLLPGDPRMADQLCRMSQLSIKTGPTAPGFCPSDTGSAGGSEAMRWQLERENAALRVELQRIRKEQ